MTKTINNMGADTIKQGGNSNDNNNKLNRNAFYTVIVTISHYDSMTEYKATE